MGTDCFIILVLIIDGGGTALLCRESVTVRRLSAGEKTSFEFSEYMIDGLSLQLRLVIVYRPPYSAALSFFSAFPEFREYLESLVLSEVAICISSDFNVHLDVRDDEDTIAFADLLESLCLTQHGTGTYFGTDNYSQL